MDGYRQLRINDDLVVWGRRQPAVSTVPDAVPARASRIVNFLAPSVRTTEQRWRLRSHRRRNPGNSLPTLLSKSRVVSARQPRRELANHLTQLFRDSMRAPCRTSHPRHG